VNSQFVLPVFLAKNHIADILLSDGASLSFVYTDSWLKDGYSLLPSFPLTRDSFSGKAVSAFIRNLLPEGHALDDLSSYFQISKTNHTALIKAIGTETAGALTFGKPQEDKPIFTPLDTNDLENRLSNRGLFSLTVWNGKPRLSVAGVQDKINVMVDGNGMLGFGDGSLCSTHILKFEKHKDTHLVFNEFLSMKLAKACGLSVANVDVVSFGEHKALLVERFDRIVRNDQHIDKRHIIDSCQFYDVSPDFKYERNFGNGNDVAHIREGISLPHLIDAATKCSEPSKSKGEIIDWLMFNLLIANHDAHGKNVSFFVDEKGISIASFYDLVNISMYPDFEQSLAMAVGNNFDLATLGKVDFEDMAVDCNLSAKFLMKRFDVIFERLNKSLAEIDIFSDRVSSEYLTEYSDNVLSRMETLARQLERHTLANTVLNTSVLKLSNELKVGETYSAKYLGQYKGFDFFRMNHGIIFKVDSDEADLCASDIGKKFVLSRLESSLNISEGMTKPKKKNHDLILE
jgi:serine/threonine-protein kinase HipA